MNKKIIEALKILEMVIAGLLLLATILAIITLILGTFETVIDNQFDLQVFFEGILTIVIGIEFIKMLIQQSLESVIEVLLFAVARQVILSHDNAMENLIGVTAIALIFAIRKFLLTNEGFEQLKKLRKGKAEE